MIRYAELNARHLTGVAHSRVRALGFLFLCACRTDAAATSDVTVRVAAAADLSRALPELGAEFERRSGHAISVSFGSTGWLAKQLREGAPFDVFAAANASFADDLVAAGACDGTTKQRYARGRIAVWTRRGAAHVPRSLADLDKPEFKRIAIANPAHAPYGQAARAALQAAGIWSAVEPRLVYGENVAQTLQLAASGNAEAAFVALALVVEDRDNPWMLVDESWHPPIDQTLVVCWGGANRAGGQAFADFVGTQAGRALMRRHGFLLPGEGLAQR